MHRNTTSNIDRPTYQSVSSLHFVCFTPKPTSVTTLCISVMS
uniref:Uncharacterized protein n=1 Tax=Arundo donax TaxID=35708 RepID=A0A0A8ZDV4_ARUDO